VSRRIAVAFPLRSVSTSDRDHRKAARDTVCELTVALVQPLAMTMISSMTCSRIS